MPVISRLTALSHVDHPVALEQSRKDIKVVEMCQLKHEFEFGQPEKCSQQMTLRTPFLRSCDTDGKAQDTI